MRGPKPPAISLADAERTALDALVRRHTTPQQLALRARIVLAAADGANNAQIARALAISVDMVRRWRARWLILQPASFDDLSLMDRLTDGPRPGKPVRITADQVTKIIALACEPPTESQRPIIHWTGREIAAEIRQRGIVDQISPRHVARLLQRGISSHT